MTTRGFALSFTLALALGGLGCSPAEQGVVDQYFRAANSKEVQTLSGFALVGFDQKADKWSIESVDPPTTSPATLPDLEKKVQEADAAVTANIKAARAYSMDHVKEVDEIREIEGKKGGGKIPPSLATSAAEWDKFNQNDRSLKKTLAEAREAAQKEKDAVVLSLVERSDDVTGLQGDVVAKKVNLVVTVGGQPKNYVMTLKKYDLHEEGKSARMSRWIVAGIDPKT